MHKLFCVFLAFLLFLTVSCNNNQKAGSSENTDAVAIKSHPAIEIYDSSVTALVDPDAQFEILAKGFYWSEGPLWVDELQSAIFSDVPANKIYRWSEKDSLDIQEKKTKIPAGGPMD